MMERFSRLAPSDQPAARTDTDTFRFVFSNQAVGRDGHVVLNRGIQTANFLRNPVILWAHDDLQPPIGRGSNIDTGGTNCCMDVTFIDRDVLPFAGTIRDLVAGSWLRALSMSWQPLEWQYSQDRSRAGGIDFTKVDLLEVSVVPLPALPDALMDARSRGINTRPLSEWAERALGTRSYHSVPRRQLEAISRAARMSPLVRRPQIPEARARAGRLARLHSLQIPQQGRQMPQQERAIYERYKILRSGYGYSIEMAASDLHMPAIELRRIIARALVAESATS